MAPPIQAIDVHGHYGVSAGRTSAQIHTFMSADATEVIRRARRANTVVTMVSPLSGLMPQGAGDAAAANVQTQAIVAESTELLQWVLVNPLAPVTYRQAAALLGTPKCAGIKIHPVLHEYTITEHGRAIFEFAQRYDAVIQTHSGEAGCRPGEYVSFADAFPEVRLIMAHLGFSDDEDITHQVRAIQASRHGNIYTDTSSAQSLTPNLIEWAVAEVGSEQILYGTDTPLYFAPMQRARIDCADIAAADRKRILRDNAIALFHLAIS